MEENPKIVDYVLRLYNAERGSALEAMLLDEGEKVQVNLKDVGLALKHFLSETVETLALSQELMEERLAAIVSLLDEETKTKIKAEFEQVGDDLFNEKGDSTDNEETTND